LGGGLTVEVHQPNYELRLSILNTKAEKDNIDVNQDVLQFLSQNIKGNIRDLEGCWTRLVTYSQWMKETITLELVHKILQDSLIDNDKKISFIDIQRAVCNYYGVEINDLKADKREKKITKARHIAMFLCREMTNSSSTDIGQVFGGKDHSSVLYAAEKIEKERKKDFALNNEIDLIKKQLKSLI